MTLLMFQHAARMAQPKTREQMAGAFFSDYATSVRNIGGWDDGDGLLTNYVAHPMMGAITGYVEVQNDRGGTRNSAARANIGIAACAPWRLPQLTARNLRSAH